MRRLIVVLASAMALSGCAGWVVFGHKIGEKPAPVAVDPSRTTSTPPTPAAAASSPQIVASNTEVASVAQVASVKPVTSVKPVAPVTSNAAQKAAVSAVEVAVSSAAQPKTSSHFDVEAVRAAVEDELRSRGLLSAGTAATDARKIQLLVEDVSVRRMTNAVVMGRVISSAKLTAHVTVRDSAGHELQSYQAVADTKLSRAADSRKGDDLSPLYRHLATLAVNGLEGAPPKPATASSANTDIPR